MPLSVDEDGKASPCHTKSSVVYFCMVFYVLFFLKIMNLSLISFHNVFFGPGMDLFESCAFGLKVFSTS